MPELVVFDVFGKQVALLEENSYKQIGINELQFDASNLSTGTYYVKMQSDKYTSTRKILIIR